MAPENNRRPRPEPDDPGFDVVGNPPARPAPRPAKPILARPLSPPPARAVPKKIIDDPGFEVVSPPPSPKKAKVRVVEHADDTEEAPRAKARTRADFRRDDDEVPRKKHRRKDEDEQDDDDRPRPRKKKRRQVGVGISDGTNNVMIEWGGPVFLMVLGLVLGLVGTIGMAMKPDSGISPVLSSTIFVVGQLIWIPIEIVGLMLIGKVFGIEYGDITSALRNLAAMGFLVGGLMSVLDWAGLSWFIYNPIIFIIGIGLFIVLFKLDVWEAIVTMFGLNVLSFAFNILMFVVLIAMIFAAAKHDRGDYDDDYDSRPSMNQPFDPDEFDDDWDADEPPPQPRPRGKAKVGPGASGAPKAPQRPRPSFPDDDD